MNLTAKDMAEQKAASAVLFAVDFSQQIEAKKRTSFRHILN